MASLRTVKWALYGYKLKHNSDSGSSERGSSGSGSSNTLLLRTGCEELMQVSEFAFHIALARVFSFSPCLSIANYAVHVVI